MERTLLSVAFALDLDLGFGFDLVSDFDLAFDLDFGFDLAFDLDLGFDVPRPNPYQSPSAPSPTAQQINPQNIFPIAIA